MTGRDNSEQSRLDFSPGNGGSSAGEDIVESGGHLLPGLRWRPPLIAVILAAGLVGLLAGLVVGYVAGDRHSGNSAAPPPRSPSAASPTAPSLIGIVGLNGSGRLCSAQIGHELQLGVQVTNSSAAAVTLRRVTPVLPLGGLTTISQAWGPCGALPAASGESDNAVPAGASAWFTVTFKVLVRCPDALPVQFTLDYEQSGRPATINLPGFEDLGYVPYAGCPFR